MVNIDHFHVKKSLISYADYPFVSFADDTTLVDVGGGIGSLAELLLPVVPHLRFVIQDLEPVVKLANEVASPNMKNWITEGRVEFQVHDFFTPQPTDLEGAVFVLKNVMLVAFYNIFNLINLSSVITTPIQKPWKYSQRYESLGQQKF